MIIEITDIAYYFITQTVLVDLTSEMSIKRITAL